MTDATSSGEANRPSGISRSISATTSCGAPPPRAEICAAATPACEVSSFRAQTKQEAVRCHGR